LFTARLWPDFDVADLEAALADFHSRQRRFGCLPAPWRCESEVPIIQL